MHNNLFYILQHIQIKYIIIFNINVFSNRENYHKCHKILYIILKHNLNIYIYIYIYIYDILFLILSFLEILFHIFKSFDQFLVHRYFLSKFSSIFFYIS